MRRGYEEAKLREQCQGIEGRKRKRGEEQEKQKGAYIGKGLLL